MCSQMSVLFFLEENDNCKIDFPSFDPDLNDEMYEIVRYKEEKDILDFIMDKFDEKYTDIYIVKIKNRLFYRAKSMGYNKFVDWDYNSEDLGMMICGIYVERDPIYQYLLEKYR